MGTGAAVAGRAETGANVSGFNEGSILQWSEFNHSKDNYPKPRSGTWDDLADKCSKPAFRPDKDGLALCASIFKVKVRRDENAIETFFFAFDLDDLPEDTDASDILASVPGLLAFTYTSHSHLMPGKGARFRLVVAISKRIPADQVRQILAAFAAKYLGRFGTAIDSKCFNPSRIFYYPSCAADRVDLFQFSRQEGAAFDWESLRDTDTPTTTDNAPAALPGHLAKMFDGKSNLLPASGKPILEGGRNNELHRRGSAMRGQGKEQDEIAGELLRLNETLCNPPLPAVDVMTIAKSVCRYPAGTAKPLTAATYQQAIDIPKAFTELAIAEAISKAYGGRFHYVAESGRWIVCADGGLWVDDVDGQIKRWIFALLAYAKERAFDLIRLGDEAGRGILAQVWKAEKSHFVNGSMQLLSALDTVTIKARTLDADAHIVGLRAGKLIDLKSAQVRDILPGDYLTKILGVEFDHRATCPTWTRCVDEWTCGDVELAKFLQIFVGYCLSGETTFQGFLFLHGGGRNGKSIFVQVVEALLGDYAKTLNPDALMLKHGDTGTNNEIARLAGARFVKSVELPEERTLNENLVKQMVGGDTLTARFLYGEWFEFQPQFKLFIVGNHRPIVRGTDDGIWRRVALVPFNARIEQPDEHLIDKLKNELPGILNWALEGWRIYQSKGIQLPAAVEKESKSYRAESDIVGRFLAERCRFDKPNQDTSSKVLFSAFKAWADESGLRAGSSISFGRRLEGRLAKKKDGKGQMVYESIYLC